MKAKHLCSVMQCVKLSFMIRNFEKLIKGMVLNFLNLVLNKYGKGSLKMCGNPVLCVAQNTIWYMIVGLGFKLKSMSVRTWRWTSLHLP